ncbi:MAG: hypothetical protein ABIH74_05965, partial [Candidatus Omnitrophota bacterium]
MHRQNWFTRSALSFLVVFTFLFNNTVQGLQPSQNTMSPSHNVFQPGDSSSAADVISSADEVARFREAVVGDMAFMSAILSVAKYHLGEIDKDTFVGRFQNDFNDQWETIQVGRHVVSNTVFEKDGIVYITYENTATGKFYTAHVCRSNRDDILNVPGGEKWAVIRNLAIFIEEGFGDAGQDTARDLKGTQAPVTDPLIEEHIRGKRVIELYIDTQTGALKANKVKWVDDYVSMVTPRSEYLGREVDVRELFSPNQKENLEAWMKSHPVRGAPAKFRIVLGSAALGWKDDVEHSNIAHAGVRDGAIYIGGLLLKQIMMDENELLREEVLDNDEYRHLRGLGDGSAEDRQRRLNMVREVIEPLEEIRTAVLENDVWFLFQKISFHMTMSGDNNNILELLNMLSVCDEVSLELYKYPVESRYPVKKAVKLLTMQEQKRLVDILIGAEGVNYHGQTLINDLLLMLDGSGAPAEGWAREHTPDLEGRTVWDVSPEIHDLSGGLGRLEQSLGASTSRLVKGTGVRYKQVEPRYQFVIGADGKPHRLDYAKDINHPLSGLAEVDRFTVTVGGELVQAVVSRGVDDQGVETYLIADVGEKGQSFYTHSVYNYRSPAESREETGLPTWKDFAVFFSKATLEFISRASKREREGGVANWNAPIVRLNDPHVALVDIYRKVRRDAEKAAGRAVIDPVIRDGIFVFKTHTYENRKTYPLEGGVGDAVMDFMEVPVVYRELFKHEAGGWVECYDMTSGGLRGADWQEAVSHAHRDDIAMYDEWFGSDVDIIGVANGDNVAESSWVFRGMMESLYGSTVNGKDLTLEKKIQTTKKIAKSSLSLPENRTFYSTEDPTINFGRAFLLDPDLPVVSYSGRFVGKKAGLKRAFTDGNIEALLRQGVQIVIDGNVQHQSSESRKMALDLIDLIRRLKGKNYTGRLVFVPYFSREEQIELFAATDIQVLDSDGRSEAAGYPEANASASAALILAPPREGVGEGLLKAQGIPITFEAPFIGNTLIPKSWSQEAYLEVIIWALGLGPEKLSHHQAMSMRLSSIIGADSTAAEDLRQFVYAIREKEVRERIREEAASARQKDDIVRSLFTANLRGLTEYEVIDHVLKGMPREAVEIFLISAAFQHLEENLDVPAKIFNRLIDAYEIAPEKGKSIRDFAAGLVEKVLIVSESGEGRDAAARAVQLMAAQTLTILSWIDRHVPGARSMRLTADESKMVKNEKRGKSYIDIRTLLAGIEEVKEEGAPGFYWRGIEGMEKLGSNILEGAIDDRALFDAAKERLVMYAMNHGFIAVPEQLKESTKNGRISTMHETFLVNDSLPGSRQTTSTGSGHFQAYKLDIKHVTEGWGIQLNVRYNEKGEIVEIIAKEVKAGNWCLALPGYVDYMVDLGGLRFNDISVKLDPEEAFGFNPHLDFSDAEKISALEEVIKKHATDAPYLGVMLAGQPAIVKTDADAPDAVWVTGSDIEGYIEEMKDFAVFGGGLSLVNLYTCLTSERNLFPKTEEPGSDGSRPFRIEISRVTDLIRDFIGSWVYDSGSSVPSIPVLTASGLKDKLESTDQEARRETTSLGKTDGILAFIDDNEQLLTEILGPGAKEDKLIRLSVESLEA